MTAGAIIIVAIAASCVLMMRFRKRWLAKINIAFTNRITNLFAGCFRVSAFSRTLVASRVRPTESVNVFRIARCSPEKAARSRTADWDRRERAGC